MRSVLSTSLGFSLCALGMGIVSGIPLMMVLVVLPFWVKESGQSYSYMGLLSLATLPYSLKFVWALVWRKTNPKLLGWSVHLGSVICLIGLGCCNPRTQGILLFVWALGVGTFASIQDLLFETFRIRQASLAQQASMTSLSYVGFRLGMLGATSGSLLGACYFSWSFVYGFFALIQGCIGSMVLVYYRHHRPRVGPVTPKHTVGQALTHLHHRMPLPLLLGAILCYQFTDTTLNMMGLTFFSDLGYTKEHLAWVVKGVGIGAMMLGGGVSLIWSCPPRLTLSLCAICHMCASSAFFVQSMYPTHLGLLAGVIIVENFMCGLAASLFLSFLAQICYGPYVMPQYAYVASLKSLGRVVLGLGIGTLADILPWNGLFGCTFLVALGWKLCIMFTLHQSSYKEKKEKNQA